MEDNLYSHEEIALMRLYEEKEVNINEEYNNLLYKHNPDQKNVPLFEKRGRKLESTRSLRKKRRNGK